jgi:transcriptional/translational regulatory protein YebC/TACO1
MAGQSRWTNITRRANARRSRQAQRTADAGGAGLESVRFEGYGPGGGAVVVDCFTADRKGTAVLLRRTFAEFGGHLGAEGSVSYLFHPVGLLSYPPGTDVATLTRAAIAAGAEEVVPNADRSVEVLTDPLEFDAVSGELARRDLAPANAEVTLRSATSQVLAGGTAERMLQLLETLESLDEVRDVYTNVEIPDEILARL